MIITSGIFKSRKISFKENKHVRPTLSQVRMCVFNVLKTLLGDFEEKSFLDFFSGSGIMSFEAFSRGFFNVFAVEKNKKTANLIKYNAKVITADIKVFAKDALKIEFSQSFDAIYIDPPYESCELYYAILKKIKNEQLLNNDGILVVEASKEIEFENFNIIKRKKMASSFLFFLKN